MYSYRVEQAIRAATILHKDQVRKGSIPMPYISHIFAVAIILLDYTDNEDVIVAALLHDTIEDTDYTLAELQEDFGGEVRELVEALSEPEVDRAAGINWLEQKRQYIKQLKKANKEALLICAADKIHNMRSIVEEYYDDHKRFMAEFRGSLNDRVMIYQDISNILNRSLDNAILAEFNHVFEEYKNFVIDVQKTKEAEERL